MKITAKWHWPSCPPHHPKIPSTNPKSIGIKGCLDPRDAAGRFRKGRAFFGRNSGLLVAGKMAAKSRRTCRALIGADTVFAVGISKMAMFQAELLADVFQIMGTADHGHAPKLLRGRTHEEALGKTWQFDARRLGGRGSWRAMPKNAGGEKLEKSREASCLEQE
jgi:hypothetical protein